MHITQRGHNRDTTFLDTQDFAFYREVLRHASNKTSTEIHAYALMSNHVHLLISSDDPRGGSRLMQHVGSRFVPYWNRRHRRSGSMWEGRFRSSIIDSERYFLACSRYIDLNPVRAGLVATPDEYAWSSYLHLADGAPDDVVTHHPVYRALGETADARQTAYAALCGDHLHLPVHAIRAGIRGGSALGGESFLRAIERQLRRRATRLPHGGDRRSGEWGTHHHDRAAG